MEKKVENENALTIKIDNKLPVELGDFARSMAAIGDEYSRFISNGENAASPRDVKLYVVELRKGSLVATLVAYAAPFAIPFVEHADTVIEYGFKLKEILSWVTGGVGKEGEEKAKSLDKETLSNVIDILDPVAKDPGARLQINAANNSGAIYINIDSPRANVGQNVARHILSSRKEPVTGTHEQVVMYWAQARSQPTSNAGDRARIESIYPGDVKVRFASEQLKSRMLHEPPHPFNQAFIVDVKVETVNGKPALYLVLNFHEILPRED